jgi:hypothetical protein
VFCEFQTSQAIPVVPAQPIAAGDDNGADTDDNRDNDDSRAKNDKVKLIQRVTKQRSFG